MAKVEVHQQKQMMVSLQLNYSKSWVHGVKSQKPV